MTTKLEIVLHMQAILKLIDNLEEKKEEIPLVDRPDLERYIKETES